MGENLKVGPERLPFSFFKNYVEWLELDGDRARNMHKNNSLKIYIKIIEYSENK